jgi:kynurenine 3-monooxygenase
MKKHIIIVGAGLAGSLCALYMLKRGYNVEVYEKRGDMRDAVVTAGKSINLALSERGWTALRKVGVDKYVEDISIAMPKRVMHDIEGNLTDQFYGNKDQAIYSVPRGGLNILLMNLAEKGGAKIFFNHECIDVDTNAPYLFLKNTITNEDISLECDLIVGADGAFSAVRNKMMRQDRFQYSQHYIEHGYKELLIPANLDGTHKIEKNALHIWPRGNFMLIALPNLDGSYTCTLFSPFDGKDSFSELNDSSDVLRFFNSIFKDFTPLIPDLVDQFFTNPTSSLGIFKCYPWHIKNYCVLIGDSAHATVPFYGQGMNASFEDCRVLDELIDKYEENMGEGLRLYSQNRKPNGDGVQDLSLHNFIVMRDKTADPKFLLQKKIEQKFAQAYPKKWTPLYSMVSFTNISYSDAWEIGMKQEELMASIMSIPNISKIWENEEVMQKMLEMLE